MLYIDLLLVSIANAATQGEDFQSGLLQRAEACANIVALEFRKHLFRSWIRPHGFSSACIA